MYKSKYDISDHTPIPVQPIIPNKIGGRVLYLFVEEYKDQASGITIPKGFITDGASTLRVMWGLFPPIDRYFIEACLHDYALDEGWGWAKANRIFNESMKLGGIQPIRRKSMYMAVSVYGYLRVRWFGDTA